MVAHKSGTAGKAAHADAVSPARRSPRIAPSLVLVTRMPRFLYNFTSHFPQPGRRGSAVTRKAYLDSEDCQKYSGSCPSVAMQSGIDSCQSDRRVSPIIISLMSRELYSNKRSFSRYGWIMDVSSLSERDIQVRCKDFHTDLTVCADPQSGKLRAR